MDKNAIKKYAVWAREELIKRVSTKAEEYGISENKIIDANADSVNGKLLTSDEKHQRSVLIEKVKNESFEQVMEEAAYTWFNRFCALRFMEVNNYLPSHVRVFTDENNSFKPQILTEAITLDLEGLDMDKVYEYKVANKDDELYKYLIITQCNALSCILPGMFEKISDYTELLFPDNILRDGSVISEMIEMIPEEDWQDAVQIIGWLYQYYNSVPKDIVFANLKKNIKIRKEDIPAATQLFTPDWIVRYMVENSLGRLWYEGHPDDSLKANWRYYLDEAEQEEDVQAQLDKIREEYKKMNPEDIKCIDPCMGSGHILVYMFDVLVQIYESYGYNTRDAVRSILENNLYGLDIDDRAAQLAYFSVMMKARQYDKRFFTRGIQPHVYSIQESKEISSESIFESFGENKYTAMKLYETFIDAKEFGSILTPDVTLSDLNTLEAFINQMDMEEQSGSLLVMVRAKEITDMFTPLITQARLLVQKYDVVVTNPPYMGGGGMSKKLSDYVKENYPDSKSDMSTVFMDKALKMCLIRGFIAMINIPVWMYLSSYIQFRCNLLKTTTLINLLYFGRGVFGSDFGTTSFILRNNYMNNYIGKYKKLFERKVDVESLQLKEEKFFSNDDIFLNKQENFWSISGNPYAYNMTSSMKKTFEIGTIIDDIASPRQGMATGNNDKYLRFWYEISINDLALNCVSVENFHKHNKLYAPYNKGGAYRKWYGNQDYVIKFNKDYYKSLSMVGNHLPSRKYYFHKSLTWSKVTMGGFSMRYMPQGFVFDVSGCSLFTKDSNIFSLLAFLNSKIAAIYFGFLSPTVNYEVGNIKAMPFIFSKTQNENINHLTKSCINVCKQDWDSFETSWDFVKHPFIQNVSTIKEAYDKWSEDCEERFNTLKANEEELNKIFIDIYGLQDELSPEEEDKDVTVRKADLKRDIKSFISYAVGCMFGRYSLDVDGLAYAGGEWDDSKYRTFPADEDNIIPICDDEYFDDDITSRFVKFVETVYGKDTLEENLQFIADALEGKGTPREVIRNYFISDKGFYADHCKIYQKRPIYWLFNSGKKNGFNALIYMHRYREDTLARMRTDYVHEQQGRYRTAISDLEHRINSAATTSERVKLEKQLSKIKDQDIELRGYEEKIHHMADKMICIDLDDGVKHNYEIFKDVLAKIK